MKTFLIYYDESVDGYGEVSFLAETIEEAKELFFEFRKDEKLGPIEILSVETVYDFDDCQYCLSNDLEYECDDISICLDKLSNVKEKSKDIRSVYTQAKAEEER